MSAKQRPSQAVMPSSQESRQVYGQVLSTVLTQKQECLQYLTVDSDTYLQWRTLARNLELTTDCDVAAFLLQHYEKTSDLQLTHCVKCGGPVVQYCVPCNIYMTQPNTASTLLQQEGVSSEEAVLPGDTILIDVSDVEAAAAALPESQQLVMVKTDDLADVDVSEVREEEMSSNQLEALVEACAMQGAIVTEATASVLEPRTSTTTTTATSSADVSRSLLTPQLLRQMKSHSTSSDPGQKTDPPTGIDSLVTTTEYQLLTSPPPLTGSQMLSPMSQLVTELDSQAAAVLDTECLPTGQNRPPAETSGGAEHAQEVAADTVSASNRSENLSDCLHILPKSELSDDESDYYCEPLFKPEKAEDEDLQTAISVLEGKVSTGNAPLSASLLHNDACIKVTQDVTLSQSAGTDADKDQPIKPDAESPDVDAGHAHLETSDSAKAGQQAKELDSGGLTESKPALGDVQTDSCAKAEAGESQSAAPDRPSQAASPERKKSGAGRKRKIDPDGSDADFNPVPGAQKGTPPVVNHTMRTRFFDKKRPSFIPFTAPLSPVKSQPPSAGTQGGQSSGRGRRGRRAGRKDTGPCEEKERQSRKRKREASDNSAQEVACDDSESDDTPHHHNEEDVYSSENKDRGDKCGKEENTSLKQEESSTKPNSQPGNVPVSTGKQEKQPDLKNQIIVITGEEDLDRLLQPKACLQSQPPGPESKEKVESGVPTVKLETNIAPLELEPPESKLASKVSIVTDAGDGSSVMPRKKRRLHSRKEARTYICDMCEEEMGSRSELKQHLQQQHGSRPFACSKCPATYKNRSHLRVHMNRHAEVKPYQCPKCPKNFASNYSLNAHITTHSTERPEVCDICGRSFKSAKYLKGHKLLHEGREKRFICQQCGARFSRKSNLLNHIKIHNNDKQYECPHCSRRFIQSGSLKSHLFRMHNPNRARPFVCEICGEARYAKDQFEKHMMIHTGTKPYKCTVCGAAFVQSNALTGHMKIHNETEGKSHWCSLCGAAFKKFASLKKHVRKIHHEYPEMSIATFEIIEVQV